MLWILIIVVIVLVVWIISVILACILVGYCRIGDDTDEPLLKDLKDEKKDNTL